MLGLTAGIVSEQPYFTAFRNFYLSTGKRCQPALIRGRFRGVRDLIPKIPKYSNIEI